MGLFGKKLTVLGMEVPKLPPAPIGQVRGAHSAQVSGPIVFEGPFDIADNRGFYLCKCCGVAFDSWNLPGALQSLSEAVCSGKAQTCFFIVGCRKCSTFNVFSPKDVLTGKAGDPTGPWTAEQIERVEPSLTEMLRLTPDEIGRIDPDALRMVLFLYK
jgi:hypothetical protein